MIEYSNNTPNNPVPLEDPAKSFSLESSFAHTSIMENVIKSDIVIASKKPSSSNRINWTGYLPSPSSLFLTCYFIISLTLNGLFNPIAKRGFFCNDTTISYPVRPDTVGFQWVVLFALLIPSFVIKKCDKKLRELMINHSSARYSDSRKGKKISGDTSGSIEAEEEELIAASSERIKKRLVVNVDSLELVEEKRPNVSNINYDQDTIDDGVTSTDMHRKVILRTTFKKTISDTQLFLFGLATTSFFTGVGKTTSGRLRPHFMQRCKPDINCNLVDNQNKYIEDYACTSGLKRKDIAYITTSWPSGHASMMFYSMLYLVLYLNTVIPIIVRLSPRRVQQKFNTMLLYIVYVLMLGVAGFVSLTRVSDYHHHPLDVLCGSIMGCVIAIVLERFDLRHRAETILSFINNI